MEATRPRRRRHPVLLASLLFLTLPFLSPTATSGHLRMEDEPPTGDCGHHFYGEPRYELEPDEASGSCTWFVYNSDVVIGGEGYRDLYWYVFRGWDLTVTVDVHDDRGQVHVERAAYPKVIRTERYPVWGGYSTREYVDHADTPQVVERATTSTAVTLTKTVMPNHNLDDSHVRERVRITYDATAAGPARLYFTVHFSRVEAGGDDCVGRNTDGSNPGVLSSGGTCRGTMADGVPRSRNDDVYALDVPVTDGDVVDWSFRAWGHTAGVRGSVAGTDGITRTLPGPGFAKPPLWGSASDSGRWSAIGDGTFLARTYWLQSDGLSHCDPGLCWTAGQYDSRSTGPFQYDLTLHHTPNARPVLAYGPLPTKVFDGDVIRVDATVDDADGQTVRPTARVDHLDAAVAFDRTSGPAGTTFHGALDTTGLSNRWGGMTGHLYLNAYDSLDVPARTTEERHLFTVYPNDCGEPGDAPVGGRAIVGACEAWVSTYADTADVLLFHVEEPGQRVALDLGGYVNVTVTTPDGTDVVVDMAAPEGEWRPVGAFYDHLEEAGTYVIHVTPTEPWAWYTVDAVHEDAPTPSGALTVTAVHLTRITDVETSDRSTNIRGVEKLFHVREDALANATEALLRVHARSTGCLQDEYRFTVNGEDVRTLAGCTVWPSGTADWRTLALPLHLLAPGENVVAFHQLERSDWDDPVWWSYDGTRDWDHSRVTNGFNEWSLGGELLMQLDLPRPALPGEALTVGLDAGFLVHTEAPDTYPAEVELDPGDGTPPYKRIVPWGEAARVAHTYVDAGTYAVDATAVSTRDGATALTFTPFDVHVVAHDDCATGRDAGVSGIHVASACAASVGGDHDAADVLLLKAPVGHHLRVEVAGNVTGRLAAPDGPLLPVVDGEVNDHVRAFAAYRLEVASATGVEEPYVVTVAATPAPAPTGDLDAATPYFTGIGNDTIVDLTASDLHHQPVAYHVTWGDGSTERVPAAGFLPYGKEAVTLTHAYTSPGAHDMTIDVETLDGRWLPTTEVTNLVVDPDDCGAGDARDALYDDAGDLAKRDLPRLDAPGRCWGSLGPDDARDHYEYEIPDSDTWRILIRPEAGVELDAEVYLAAGSAATGVSWTYITRKEVHADGTIEFRPSILGGDGTLLLRIMDAGAPGNYEVETRTGAA